MVRHWVARHRHLLALATLVLLLALDLHLQGALPTSLHPHSSIQQEEEKRLEVKPFREDLELREVEEDPEEVPRPAGPPPSQLGGVVDTLREVWRLSSNIRTPDGLFNIKPLVNLTINRWEPWCAASDYCGIFSMVMALVRCYLSAP